MIKKKLPARKPAPKRVGSRVVNPTLAVFTGVNFTGTSRRYRGNLGVRNLTSVGLNDTLQSLRLTTPAGTTGTVVLFEDAAYQGNFVTFSPSAAGIADLADFNFDNIASSLVVSSLVLSAADIALIQASGLNAPFSEILVLVRAARKRRAAKRKGK